MIQYALVSHQTQSENIIIKVHRSCDRYLSWGPFLYSPETFRAGKAVFSSSVPKNGEVYTPDTSCMKGTSLYIKNM